MLLAGVARRLLWRVHGDEGGISKRAFDGRGNGNDDTFLRFANSYNFVCSLRLDEVETSMTSRWKRSQSENKSSLSQEILRKLRPSLAPNNEDDVVVAPAGLLIAAPTRGSEITTYECTTRYYRVRHIPRDLEIRRRWRWWFGGSGSDSSGGVVGGGGGGGSSSSINHMTTVGVVASEHCTRMTTCPTSTTPALMLS
ncbi:hypothetical protein HZH66_002126 [Vespula vulgaris]|uniref:Uncharacterized protein n=1 Tax=Vespula vulgaris TaxID=7454 RepID=A0A834KGJ9_VESVU|nr:hypothetical protein HZH66_002126 [Vespula vulgaris]